MQINAQNVLIAIHTIVIQGLCEPDSSTVSCDNNDDSSSSTLDLTVEIIEYYSDDYKKNYKDYHFLII